MGDVMKQYLTYKRVQQQLDEYFEKTGERYSFFEAVADLYRKGAYTTAEALPVAPFEHWDITDAVGFDMCMDEAPVDIDAFKEKLDSDLPTSIAARHVIELDTLPMKVGEHQAMYMHYHDSFEVLYVLKGKAKLYLGSLNPREFVEGDFCMTAPQFEHDVVADDGCTVVSITLAELTIENTLYKLLQHENMVSDFFRMALSKRRRGYTLFKMPPNKRIFEIIRNIFNEGYSNDEYSKEICSSYIEILFSHLLRGYALNIESFSEERTEYGSPPMLLILKYIQTNYKTCSLGEIAELFHYEPNYLGKLIKAYMGKNYTEIIAELRISEAKALLRDTKMNIENIAEQAGFNSAVHFSRSFRTAVGMTPSKFRSNKSSLLITENVKNIPD